MSAQASPLTPTGEKISTLSVSNDAIELSVSRQTEGMALTISTPNSATDKLVEEKDTPEQDPANLEQDSSAIAEVEALQQAILEDENFDFSTLDAPAAGLESPISLLDSEESLLAAPPIAVNSHSTLNYYADNSVSTNGPDASITTASNPLIEDNEITNTSTNIGQSNITTTEDFSTQVSGKIDSDFTFKDASTDTNYGNISYNSDGEWTFTLDNNAASVQALGEGDQLQESIALETIGGSTFTLELVVNGADDTAVITGSTKSNIQTLSNTEQSELKSNGSDVIIQISGTLSAEDIDQGESHFQANSELSCTFGTASIDTEGNWVYTLDHEKDGVKGLTSKGKPLLDFFTVESADGSKQQIEVTIQGADDTPVITINDNFSEINLSDSTSSSGYMPISDPDFSQSTFLANSEINGEFGVGSISESGQWSYEVDTNNARVASLGEDGKLTDSFLVETKDGTEFTIIARIIGSDSPVFSTASDEALLKSISTEETAVSLSSLIIDDISGTEVDSMLSATFDTHDITTKSTTSSQATGDGKTEISTGNSENEILLQLTQSSNLDLV